jgi:hypothetical protein
MIFSIKIDIDIWVLNLSLTGIPGLEHFLNLYILWRVGLLGRTVTLSKTWLRLNCSHMVELSIIRTHFWNIGLLVY